MCEAEGWGLKWKLQQRRWGKGEGEGSGEGGRVRREEGEGGREGVAKNNKISVHTRNRITAVNSSPLKKHQ
jgi:hypothetical protein